MPETIDIDKKAKTIWKRKVRDPNLDIQIYAYRRAVWDHLNTWERGALTDLATNDKAAEYLAGLKKHAKRLGIKVNLSASTKSTVVPSKATA